MVLYYITDKHTFSFSLAHRLLLLFLLHSAIRSPSFLRLNIFARLGFSSFSLYFFFLPPLSLVRKRERAEEARYHVSKLADRQTDRLNVLRVLSDTLSPMSLLYSLFSILHSTSFCTSRSVYDEDGLPASVPDCASVLVSLQSNNNNRG